MKCIWSIYIANDILRQINQDDNWDGEMVTGGRGGTGGQLQSKQRQESKLILLVVNLSLSLVWL